MIRLIPIVLFSLLFSSLSLFAQADPHGYSLGKKDREIDSTLIDADALETPVTLSVMPAAVKAARAAEAGVITTSRSASVAPVVSGVVSGAAVSSAVTTSGGGKASGMGMAAVSRETVTATDGAIAKRAGYDRKLSAKGEIAEREDVAKPEPAPRAGQLTAGEWSDLSEWTFWNSVTASRDWKHMNDYWGFGKGERIAIRVDNGRDPIPDAVVRLYDKEKKLLWTARTDNFGRAELFTGLSKKDGEAPYEVVVASGGKESRLGGIDPSREQSPSESPLVVRLGVPAPALKMVDLMFMVDATGSMGDELTYIKSELQSVIDRVREEMGEEFVIRLSTNVYRDKGDEYIVRSHAFDAEIESAAEFLRNQSANGGGDTPEAVEAALEDAVRNHEWSGEAQSRFLFFVLDAPPHYRADIVARIGELTREASEKGIRIIGVSSSGVDKETEFLMRNLGVHTGGTYVFLTDDSGIGESHIEPTIGSYAVEYLDDLIVRLIVQYTKRPESVDAIAARKPRLE